jgi:hypothetical protein
MELQLVDLLGNCFVCGFEPKLKFNSGITMRNASFSVKFGEHIGITTGIMDWS